jgi:TetR/AcrR family transcriptional regulator
MSEQKPGRGRVHDAVGAQEAILNAAETAFAERGFDGARIDAIAKASTYNSGLLFHYFGDKLGLYAEVVKRADAEMSILQAGSLAPLLQGEINLSTAASFKTLFEGIVATNFDYLEAHPRFTRILLWEQAQGWQTFARIFSQFDAAYSQQFDALFRKAYAAGLLRSNFSPLIQLSMVLQVCQTFITFMPLYQMALHPAEDLDSAAARQRGREYIISFVVHAMLIDLPEQPPGTSSHPPP